MSLNKTLQNLYLLFLLFHSTSPVPVLKIHDSSFRKQSTIHENILIMYYSHRCHFCNRMASEYERASELLAADHPRVRLARIDCGTTGRYTCNRQDVQEFPALKLYKNGQYIKDYLNPRIAWNIAVFMRAQINPSSRKLVDKEDFRLFLLEQEDTVLVGFFSGPSKLKDRFFRVAEDTKEHLVCAHTSNIALLRRHGVYDGIVLFRPSRFRSEYEEEKVLYPGRPVVGEIKTFIVNHFYGLVGYRTAYNLQDFENPLIVLYYSTDYMNVHKERLYWRNRIIKVAYKYKSAAFAISVKEEFQDEMEYFGLDFDPSARPIVTATGLDSQKYLLEAEFSAEALDDFVHDFLARKLIPFDKTRDHVGKSGDVIIVNRRNFKKQVIKNKKDTLLMFHAPYCGTSDDFKPIFEDLAKKLRDENIEFASYDVSENKVPNHYTVRVLPAVYWLAKDKKTQPHLYTGRKDFNELLRFIAKKANKELILYNRRGYLKETREKDEL